MRIFESNDGVELTDDERRLVPVNFPSRGRISLADSVNLAFCLLDNVREGYYIAMEHQSEGRLDKARAFFDISEKKMALSRTLTEASSTVIVQGFDDFIIPAEWLE